MASEYTLLNDARHIVRLRRAGYNYVMLVHDVDHADVDAPVENEEVIFVAVTPVETAPEDGITFLLLTDNELSHEYRRYVVRSKYFA